MKATHHPQVTPMTQALMKVLKWRQWQQTKVQSKMVTQEAEFKALLGDQKEVEMRAKTKAPQIKTKNWPSL